MMSGDFLLNSLAKLGHNSGAQPEADAGDDPSPSILLKRGREKHRKAMANLPAGYRESPTYATLGDWLAANPSPRQWARRTARELMAESAAFRELGMDLSEATHWLAELAHKWKRRAEAQSAKEEG